MAGVFEPEITELNKWCRKDDGGFVISSPITWVYNCIAFAMGSQDMWVAAGHPRVGWYAWWPPTVERTDKPQSLIDAFKYMGFEECEDIFTEEGYDKVVLYQKLKADGCFRWTHAAKVIDDHRLHSKLGALHDVMHRSGDIFEECEYGSEYAYMKRPIEKRDLTKQLLPTQSEVIILGVRHLLTFDGATLISNIVMK